MLGGGGRGGALGLGLVGGLLVFRQGGRCAPFGGLDPFGPRSLLVLTLLLVLLPLQLGGRALLPLILHGGVDERWSFAGEFGTVGFTRRRSRTTFASGFSFVVLLGIS